MARSRTSPLVVTGLPSGRSQTVSTTSQSPLRRDRRSASGPKVFNRAVLFAVGVAVVCAPAMAVAGASDAAAGIALSMNS